MTNNKIKVVHKGGPAGAFFLTFIGALVYFVQNSHGFWGFILAFLKACVWPAIFIHHVFQLLHI